MSGFKNFLLRGNLIELAVAFIMGGAFATVVTATVAMLMDVIGYFGDTPDFSDWKPNGISVGAFITALISFVILAAVVYFAIVLPYTKAREKLFPVEEEESGTPDDVLLLQEIRDLLQAQAQAGGRGGPEIGPGPSVTGP